MNKQALSVFIVDDHDLFREGVKYVLSKSEKYTIIGEAANGVEFLEKISSVLPDVVLMDIDMPAMNGFEATQRAVSLYSHIKIIVLSMHGDQGHYQKMTELGVKGFVLKDSGSSQLQLAIDEVCAGRNYFSQELLLNIILNKEQSPHGKKMIEQFDISQREIDILELMCKAKTNKQIADELFISPKTVEGHKAKLMQKTDTSNSVALVLFAIKNHLIEL